MSSGLLIVYLIIKNLPPNFWSFNEMFVTYVQAENFYNFSQS